MRLFLLGRFWLAMIALVAAGAARGSEPPKPPPDASAAAKDTPAPRPAPPAPSSTLDVTVLDPAEKPVEGAFVTAQPVVGAYVGMNLQAGKVRSAVTGKDGRARLERMPRGPWRVSALPAASPRGRSPV